MDSLNVRIALESDIVLIRDLALRIWPAAYREMISREQIDYMLDWMYAEDALRSQMVEEGCVFFIAERIGVPCGFASVSVDQQQAKLNKLYVLTEQQGQGVGQSLLQASVDYARARGSHEMVLQVNKNNQAQHFYRKQGFSLLEEAVFDIGNGFVMDDYIMIRPI